MTLLDYVQDILNDMDSDEVDSIEDTTESEQVAQIVKSTYYALMNSKIWPHQKKRIQLNSPASAADPVKLTLPENVKELVLVNYDCAMPTHNRKLYKELRWVENDVFLRRANSLNNTQPNVQTITDATGVEYFIRNDVAPTVYTSFDDVNLVFDSFDSSMDSYIDPDKAQVIAYTVAEWVHEDEFTPDLPAEAVTLLLEEAKSRAMFKLKQMVDVKAEREVRRQNVKLSRKSWRVNGGIKYPNYGRRSRK